MSTDYNVLTFKAINTFINDLNEIFGNTNHSLQLYHRLINKTTFSHENAIQKHIETFKNFSIANRDALMNKDINKLVLPTIEYSTKVYIDIKNIMSTADKETLNVIWKHLLTISAFVDPAGKAKDILKKSCSVSNETNFLENIINKVESNINPNSSNPTEVIGSLLSSGVFNDLLAGMNNKIQDGTLDLSKLIGNVEKMCSTMDGGNNGSTGGLNLSSLMSSVGPLLSTIGQQQQGTNSMNLDEMMKQIVETQNTSKVIVEEDE